MNRNFPSSNGYQRSDIGLATQTASQNRTGKQTASGDTADSTLCEQEKRALPEHSTESNTYTKDAHTNLGGTKVAVNTVQTSQQLGPSGCSAPRYSNSTTCPPTNTIENKTNLIINYLPPNMSQEEVRALFSSVGEVESCKLVREKTSGESLGYAFVKFYDPVDAGKAIKTLNGLRLQNKTVKVSLARPSSEAIKGANLYICGLPRKMTQVELEKLFGTCGHIITARILNDTKTGLSRGVAFIRYDQRAEAEFAIRKLNGYLPPGATEQITVKFANSPSANRMDNTHVYYNKFMEGDSASRFFMGTNGGPNKMSGPADMTSPTRRNGNDPSAHQSKGGDTNVGGIAKSPYPPSRTNQMTGDQHSGVNCENSGPYTTSKEVNPSSLVEPPQSACYQNPIIAHGFPVPLPQMPTSSGGRADHSSMQRINANPRFKYYPASVSANMTNMRSNGIATGPVAGNFSTGLPPFGMDFMRNLAPSAQALLAPAFAASSGALTATGWCIFVYNLAPDAEDSVLWQLFGPFGAVQTVKVIRDPLTNKCRGFGFVTMSNYEEALLAIHSLNGFNLGNRVLQVSFKTTPNSRQMRYMNSEPTGVNPLMANLNGSTTPVPGSFSTT